MAIVDKWPDEEGMIVDGIIIGFVEAGAIVLEGRGVDFGTAATGKVVCTLPSAVGDSWGVALKTGVVGKPVPIAISGVVKMVSTGTFNAGEMVMGGAAGRAGVGNFLANTTALQMFAAAGATTGSYILGMALQTATTEGDEVLIALGKVT